MFESTFSFRFGLVLGCLAAFALFGSGPAASQSLSPGESAIFTPTADLRHDGLLTIGYGRIPNRLAPQSVGPDRVENVYHEVYLYTVQFLPRIALHVRMSFINENGVLKGEDRMLGINVGVLKESPSYPAVAVGVRDVSGTRTRHASYVVATKGIKCGWLSASGTAGLSYHLLQSKNYELEQGIFGGLTLGAFQKAEVLIENDVTNWNVGFRLRPLDFVWLLIYQTQKGERGFSLGLSTRLKSDG